MLYVDPPTWPARGRLWSHLVSDVSYDEVHAFAEMIGVPRRAFERDHYDIPQERFGAAVWLGARVVPSREIAARLTSAGLRRRKFSGQPGQFPAQVGPRPLLPGQPLVGGQVR